MDDDRLCAVAAFVGRGLLILAAAGVIMRRIWYLSKITSEAIENSLKGLYAMDNGHETKEKAPPTPEPNPPTPPAPDEPKPRSSPPPGNPPAPPPHWPPDNPEGQ